MVAIEALISLPVQNLLAVDSTPTITILVEGLEDSLPSLLQGDHLTLVYCVLFVDV